MAILLVRHGETDLNAQRIIQFPDTPLSERGLAQADHLGRHLAGRQIGHILSSDYARALQTATSIEHHTGAPLELNERLRERNFGDMRGTRYTGLDAGIYAPDYEPPAGESWPVFHARVDVAWREVLGTRERMPGGDLVVVTHGLVCDSLFDRVLDAPGDNGDARRVVPNTSFTVIDDAAPWRIRRFACVDHLAP